MTALSMADQVTRMRELFPELRPTWHFSWWVTWTGPVRLSCCRFRGHDPKLIRPSVRTLPADVADHRVPAFRVVEAFDVVEYVGSRLIAGPVDFPTARSVFNDEKKLSIAELSHTFPARLIEQDTPAWASRRWNCSLAYRLPRSE